MTRRELGFSAMAAAAMAKAQTSPSNLDPVHWTLDRYKSAPLRMTFRATSKPDAEVWQQQLRAKVTELLGGVPARIALSSQTLEVREFATYRREKFMFESQPGGVWSWVFADTLRQG